MADEVSTEGTSEKVHGCEGEFLPAVHPDDSVHVLVKVTVDLQRPNFANFFFFVPVIAKISI